MIIPPPLHFFPAWSLINTFGGESCRALMPRAKRPPKLLNYQWTTFLYSSVLVILAHLACFCRTANLVKYRNNFMFCDCLVSLVLWCLVMSCADNSKFMKYRKYLLSHKSFKSPLRSHQKGFDEVYLLVAIKVTLKEEYQEGGE